MRLSRRAVLQSLGGAALAGSFSRLALAAQDGQPARRVRWAAGWLLWRDYRPRRYTLVEALADLKASGADGIEFTPKPGELEAAGLTIEAAARLIRDAGLAVSAHYFSGPFCDDSRTPSLLAEAQTKCESLKAFGGSHLVIGPPQAPAGMSRMDAITKMAPVLEEVGRLAGRRGIAIGLHPHLNTVVETPDETDAILARCDPALVGLALDTGHYHLAGGDVVGVVKRHGRRLNYLHFKDAVRPFSRPDFFPNLRDLGAGEVDFPGMMHELRTLGYRGWINVEQDFTGTTPGASWQASLRCVRDVLGPIYR